MTTTKTDWRTMAARMRGELDRADLSGRARRMAEVSIKLTLMKGRTRVVIPNRMELCALLQIGKNHVAEVLAALVSSRILDVKEVADGWQLLVFPDSAGWDVGWIYSRETMQAFLDRVERAPGQCQGELIEPAACLDRTMAEVSAESAMQRALEKSRQFPKREPANAANSRNGNFAPSPVNSKLTVHSVTAMKPLSSEQLTGTGVPANGGTITNRPRNENEIMDLLKELVGEKDVVQWGGDWRKNWVRKYPQKFQAAVETLIAERKEGWKPKVSIAAALKDLTRRYAGEIK